MDIKIGFLIRVISKGLRGKMARGKRVVTCRGIWMSVMVLWSGGSADFCFALTWVSCLYIFRISFSF